MTEMIRKENPAAWIERVIREFWSQSSENTLGGETDEKAWEEPVVGYSNGEDPLYGRFKDEIGPFFWTPLEAFRLAFPEEEAEGEELTVISWVFPQTEATRRDQRREKDYPAERWARSRDFGEKFNVAMRLHLADVLTENGIPAVAPERLPGFDYRHSERFGIASNWSERHVAYVAGMGTFGLSDGLITRRGKAVRIGSVVARIAIPPTPRTATDHLSWCLRYASGGCGVCIDRCPAGAISDAGHDKERCFAYIRNVAAPYARERFGTDATPCGLCQVGIPCESRSPVTSS